MSDTASRHRPYSILLERASSLRWFKKVVKGVELTSGCFGFVNKYSIINKGIVRQASGDDGSMGYLSALSRKCRRAWHDFLCAGVLRTPPIRVTDAGPVIVSMVCHRDIIMYLVAAKSFYRVLGAGIFVLVDDGSLTDSDRATLRTHLGDPKILPIGEIVHPDCPQGGTWERLIKILELAQNNYVIQLDADTLTVGDLATVKQCVDENVSFTLGTNAGRAVASVRACAEAARTKPGNHVQDIAERNLDRLREADLLNYVRGCSGFAGFAKGKVSLEAAADFSAQMFAMLGDRWREWGSEQVASNYVVANSGGIVLPHPAYMSFQNDRDVAGSQFLHFIGPHRYEAGLYTRLSHAFIQSVLSQR